MFNFHNLLWRSAIPLVAAVLITGLLSQRSAAQGRVSRGVVVSGNPAPDSPPPAPEGSGAPGSGNSGNKDGGPWIPSAPLSAGATNLAAGTNSPDLIQLSFQGANIDMVVQWLSQTTGKSIERTERDLKALFPREHWNQLHLRMIFYGRAHCSARSCNGTVCEICRTIGGRKVEDRKVVSRN